MEMNRNLLAAAFAAAMLLTVCGCRTVEPADAHKFKAKPEKIAGDISSNALQFQKDFFKAIQTKDRKLFVKNLVPELQEKIKKNGFKKFSDNFEKNKGKIESTKYLGDLNLGLLKVYLWKMRFEKDRKKLKDGTVIVKDTLFTLLVGQVDGKYKIFSWSFR